MREAASVELKDVKEKVADFKSLKKNRSIHTISTQHPYSSNQNIKISDLTSSEGLDA